MFRSPFIPLQHDAPSWSAALLSRRAQSIPLPLLEQDCSWEMGCFSCRRSALDPKYLDSFWSQLKSLPNKISMAFVVVVVVVSSFIPLVRQFIPF